MSGTPPPADPPPVDPPAADPPASSPLWADADKHVLSGDFADHLEGVDNPADLNQRFGNQPIQTFLQSWRDSQTTISQGGRVIPYPEVGSPETDVAKWRNAHGLTDEFKAGDYKLAPEEPVEGFSEEVAGMFAEKFLELGVPPGLAHKLRDAYMEIEAQCSGDAQKAYQQGLQAEEERLKREWGPGYEEKMSRIKTVMAHEGFDPGNPDLFDNPTVVRFLGKVVGMIGEDTVAAMADKLGTRSPMAPSGRAEAEKIMTDSNHPLHEAYRNATSPDDPAVLEVQRLLGQQ